MQNTNVISHGIGIFSQFQMNFMYYLRKLTHTALFHNLFWVLHILFYIIFLKITGSKWILTIFVINCDFFTRIFLRDLLRSYFSWIPCKWPISLQKLFYTLLQRYSRGFDVQAWRRYVGRARRLVDGARRPRRRVDEHRRFLAKSGRVAALVGREHSLPRLRQRPFRHSGMSSSSTGAAHLQKPYYGVTGFEWHASYPCSSSTSSSSSSPPSSSSICSSTARGRTSSPINWRV